MYHPESEFFVRKEEMFSHLKPCFYGLFRAYAKLKGKHPEEKGETTMANEGETKKQARLFTV